MAVLNKCVCVILSSSVDLQATKEYLEKFVICDTVIFLSSHKLFRYERDLLNAIADSTIYYCFDDFCNSNCAQNIDRVAFEQLCERDSQSVYFQYIKRKKNESIFNNLGEYHDITDGYIFSCDLGIDQQFWVSKGYVDRCVKIDRAKASETTKCFLVRLRKKIQTVKNAFKINAFVWEHDGINYLYVGEMHRIRQYLSANVSIHPIRYNIIDIASLIVRSCKEKLRKREDKRYLSCKTDILNRIVLQYHVSELLCSVHEHSPQIKLLAKKIGLKYCLLQDGFLPENFNPYLYKKYISGDKFYIWNELSSGLMKKIPASYSIGGFYKKSILPEIAFSNIKVRNVLVLTSGAGDWTAEKNRSDDDKMLEAFVGVASQFPSVKFVYRCHPLWAHPGHQGVGSLARAVKYIQTTGLKNIKISESSIRQSERFANDGILYVPPSSVADEIKKADLVFGEHSYSMIDAAMTGKLIASVLIADRTNYFSNYSKLGFQHLESSVELNCFFENVCLNIDETIRSHNKAVRLYNKLSSG